MDAIVKMLEKHQPFFEKISRNIYLQAIKDGFLGCMPIVLTSSIFLLIATLPGVVGIRTTLKKGGLLLGYNPRAPGSRLKARARTSSRPSAS